MKYFPHLVDALVGAIKDCEQYPADRVIEYQFKNHRKWGARDRRFFAENLYDVVRWKRLLENIAPENDNPKELNLWLSLLVVKELPLPAFCHIDEKQVRKKHRKIQDQRAIAQSVPDWIDRWGSDRFKNWSSILCELNQPAPVFLRPNSLKTDISSLREQLHSEAIETEVCESSLRLTERKNVFRTQAFKKGWFEVQDLNSQKVAPLLDVQPGMRVVDACSGAGGKALHLAALMQNKGKIISLDIHDVKLKEQRKRAARAGCDIIETRHIDRQKILKRLENSCERLLLDVPCSGLGVLRRNPDSKWNTSEAMVKNLLQTQQEILSQYSKMLRPGGKMVYSTCSIFPDENREQVDRFLQENANFSLIEDKTLFPIQGGGDGFYLSLLCKDS